jgi:hypothetical protein
MPVIPTLKKLWQEDPIPQTQAILAQGLASNMTIYTTTFQMKPVMGATD